MKKIILLTATLCMITYMINAQTNYALEITADGTSFYLAGLDEILVSNLTMEGWVKFDGAVLPVDNYTALVDFRNASNAASKALIFKTLDDNITTSYEWNEQWVYEGAGNIVPADEWHHIAIVISGDDAETRFYIDGVETGTDASYTLGDELPLGENIRVGAGLSAETFRTVLGIMDEIRIWTIARTEDEIFENMAKQIDPASEGLLMYYRCNEEDLDILHDATDNGYDLAVTGGTDYEFVDDTPFELESGVISERSKIINTYPNPVKDILNFNKDFQNAAIRIYDITGQLVEETLLNSSFLNVANIETGMYILEIKEGNNFYNGKFIKE